MAVTNDFSRVQITSRRNVPLQINEPPPPARGVTVSWGQGGPVPEIPRLRAIEVLSHRTLPVGNVAGVHRVTLPAFDVMALLVVTRA